VYIVRDFAAAKATPKLVGAFHTEHCSKLETVITTQLNCMAANLTSSRVLVEMVGYTMVKEEALLKSSI